MNPTLDRLQQHNDLRSDLVVVDDAFYHHHSPSSSELTGLGTL
jgi:histidinol-phosphate/aromatic aminotransferase/cobyric acid decarboxylase-like protein